MLIFIVLSVQIADTPQSPVEIPLSRSPGGWCGFLVLDPLVPRHSPAKDVRDGVNLSMLIGF
jgi:hypothetical protein